MAQMLTERYRDRLLGVLSCYDRMVITGTLPGVCFAEGMTSFMRSRGIRIGNFVQPKLVGDSQGLHPVTIVLA